MASSGKEEGPPRPPPPPASSAAAEGEDGPAEMPNLGHLSMRDFYDVYEVRKYMLEAMLCAGISFSHADTVFSNFYSPRTTPFCSSTPSRRTARRSRPSGPAWPWKSGE